MLTPRRGIAPSHQTDVRACRTRPLEFAAPSRLEPAAGARSYSPTVVPGHSLPAGMKICSEGVDARGRHTVVPRTGAGQQFARGVAPHRPLSRRTVGSTQERLSDQQTPRRPPFPVCLEQRLERSGEAGVYGTSAAVAWTCTRSRHVLSDRDGDENGAYCGRGPGVEVSQSPVLRARTRS
jgi:hypothetical protein